MKIIDDTPYFNHETGEISIIDRGRAMMQYGAHWLKEVEGQQQVIAVLDKVLDKSFTLLHNVVPAGLDARFPLILIGPPGVYVMYVTPLIGMFRAKGDQWGTITGSNFKLEKPNLLTRTERMARAISVFLQRQGYTTLINVDPILLCSDPSFNVDSIRPIIRVVMRDALERFAISLAQARVGLNQESINDIVQRILNPPKLAAPQPEEMLAGANPQDEADQAGNPPGQAFVDSQSTPPLWSSVSAPAEVSPVLKKQNRRMAGLNRQQLIILIIIFMVWLLLMAFFLVMVLQTNGLFS
jgi:hypothetical protein